MNVDDCRFCILPEPERILLKTSNFVVMMGLGPITQGYILILSKTHYSCCAAIPEELALEFQELVDRVAKAQREVYGCSLFFEHGRSGSCMPNSMGEDHCFHAHLHLVPTTAPLASRVGQDYDLQLIRDWPSVRASYKVNPAPYILVQTQGGISFYSTPEKLARHYLRSVLAELYGVPHLADWMAFPSYRAIFAGRELLLPYFD